jgi:hypothetical protein
MSDEKDVEVIQQCPHCHGMLLKITDEDGESLFYLRTEDCSCIKRGCKSADSGLKPKE